MQTSADLLEERPEPTGVELRDEAATDGEFASSVYELLRFYARQRRCDSRLAAGLREMGVDLADTLANGLLVESVSGPEGTTYSTILRALPELWWLDLHLDVHGTDALSPMLPDDVLHRLRSDALELCRRLDRGVHPAAWETGADLFSSLIGDAPDAEPDLGPDHEWARLLARGVGLTVAMSPDWIGPALRLVESGLSRELLRALVRDERLVEQDRWLGGLLLRGGPRAVATATASLLFASQGALTRLRSLLSVAPPTAMLRVAEAHGLLTLAGEDGLEVAEVLRTAFLAQAWQGNDLSGLGWWKAFRGEQLVSRSLPELDGYADDLARDVCLGLPQHLDNDATVTDPARREAVAAALAFILEREPRYDAALRISEGRIRELLRTGGGQVEAAAMRGYAMVLLAAARVLLRREGGRARARDLYARILRLRKAHPQLLPRDVFPDTLDAALHIADPDRAARRWLTRELAGEVRERPQGPPVAPTPQDPLPAPDEVVAAAEGTMPLPLPLAFWVGARRRTLPGLLGMLLLPLPFRHLANLAARLLGLTPRVRFVLGHGGNGAVVESMRLLGVTVRTTRRPIAGGCLFTFPDSSERADRLLARWAAGLILAATIGTWLMLTSASFGSAGLDDAVLGAVLLLAGLVGYAGALSLHRTVSAGLAVAAQDETGRVRVWRVDADTRHVLQQLGSHPVPAGTAAEIAGAGSRHGTEAAGLGAIALEGRVPMFQLR